MSTATMQLVSKLSLKQIIGKLDVKSLHALPEGQQEVELFNIGGTCSGTKLGMTTFGEFCAFLGSFAAVRLTDGMVFRAPQLFLPTVAEAFIRPVVDAAGGQPVEFGFIIGVKPLTKPDGTLSYEYTVKPIVAPDTIDPLADMIRKLQGAPRLLGSSSVAEEQAPATQQGEVIDGATGEITGSETHAASAPHDGKGKKK